MISTQSPSPLPHIHSLPSTVYTNLSAPSRRTAGISFLCTSPATLSTSNPYPTLAPASVSRRPSLPPRRNAIAYAASDHNPFADPCPSHSASPIPSRLPAAPTPKPFTRPRSTSFSAPSPSSQAPSIAPLLREQRTLRARALASMLLNRTCASSMRRRIPGPQRTYVRSGLSACVWREEEDSV
ncbi:hypothetical protein EW146_g8307 [Bondarzewia mesenterica]|uniref:Uncharacterized protein n=1 Tax=Bondarzewia mesenterica TaxID=1095465 RepID=A0A4S4LG11_9AGAM|nr:hypothetical protein EW146_g8307 [Bondarzewia mesenterica]